MLKDFNTRSVSRSIWKTDRTTSFLIILLSYVIALVVGLIVYHSAGHSLWWNLLFADLSATLVIWVCSLVLDNASVYDPYWSVQPMVILPLLTLQMRTFNLSTIILCAVVLFWGYRLTANWAGTFNGLHQQDWRYDQIKRKTGVFYPIVNLLGIQVMPTLIVFFCLSPGIYFVSHSPNFSMWMIPGLAVSLVGIVLEMIADRQMLEFRKQNPDRASIIRVGLWQHSRHPNYLGEILMWWGVFLTCLAVYPSAWQLGLGALLNTALFLFISIPMAEKKLAEYKVGFVEYQQQTRRLLPLAKRTKLSN
jgi:steroid 5-alpha reductase family enzyme